MTAFQSMMLLSCGAPLIPAGGSCCRRLKSRISRFLAGVDISYAAARRPQTLARVRSISGGPRLTPLPLVASGIREASGHERKREEGKGRGEGDGWVVGWVRVRNVSSRVERVEAASTRGGGAITSPRRRFVSTQGSARSY